MNALAAQWRRYWFTPESPLNLGLCRLLCFGLTLGIYFRTPFAQLAAMGETSAFWEPVLLFRALAAAGLHVPSPGTMTLLVLGWKVALALACVGLFTQVATATSFLLGIYLLGLTNNFGKASHTANLLVVTIGILAFSRCGDGCSLDALRRGTPGIPSGEYRWPVRAVWMAMALVFFGAAISKWQRTGLEWVTSDRLAILLAQWSHRPTSPPSALRAYIASHSGLASALAGLTLAVETLFPLALLHRRARVVLPALAFGTQLGITAVMGIWFEPYLASYVFWVPWGRWLEAYRLRVRATPASPTAS